MDWLLSLGSCSKMLSISLLGISSLGEIDIQP